ncbi:N5-glutamine S-adenosyl-L-methionine-dependent methyltransferase, partial [mine drainage metagenome]
ILRDAPQHLRDDGLLIVEVGESARALTELLPELPLLWLDFKAGPMGVFLIERAALLEHAAAIHSVAATRA